MPTKLALIALCCMCLSVAAAPTVRPLNEQTLTAARETLNKSPASVAGAERATSYNRQLETATWLLTSALTAASDAERARLRTDIAQTSLAHLRMLKQRLSEVATDQRPVLNVTPPIAGGQAVYSGMSPQAIKDPTARRAYEDAIHANSELAARVNEQEMLRNDVRLLSALFKQFVQIQFAATPLELARWQAELDTLN